jgi:hypothetical protein
MQFGYQIPGEIGHIFVARPKGNRGVLCRDCPATLSELLVAMKIALIPGSDPASV